MAKRTYNPYKRVYFDKIKEWMMKHKKTTGTLTVAGFFIFYYLVLANAIIITSGNIDITCTKDVCSYDVNFTAIKDAFIYPNDNWFTVYNPDGTVNDNVRIEVKRIFSNGAEYSLNFSKECRHTSCGAPVRYKTAKYAIKFAMGKSYTYRFYIYNKRPWETIEFKFFEHSPYVKGIGNKDDYFRIAKNEKNEVERYIDIGKAWTEYWDCNPTNELITKEEKNLSAEFIHGNEYIKNQKIQYWTTEERERNETYVKDRKWIEEMVSVNDTLVNMSRWENIYDTRIVKYNESFWSDEIPDTKIGICHKVRVYADLKITLGDRKIEHIPEIYGEKFGGVQ